MKLNSIPLQAPITPGDLLESEFMKPLGLTQIELASLMKVSNQRINVIVNGNCEVTPDTAIRLGRVFGVSAEFWLQVEMRNALWKALNDGEKSLEYENIKRLRAQPRLK